MYKELPTSCTFEFRQVLLVNVVVSFRTVVSSVPLGLVRPVVEAPVDSILHRLLRVKPEALLVIRLCRHLSRTHTYHNLKFEHCN